MEKSIYECKKLINKIRQKNIVKIYHDEYNKNMFKFDYRRYLAIYKYRGIPTSRRIYFKMDK